MLYCFFLLFFLFIIILYINKPKTKNNTNNTIESFYTLFTPYYYPNDLKVLQQYGKKPDPYKGPRYNFSLVVLNQQFADTNLRTFIKSLISYKFPVFNVELRIPDITDVNEFQIVDNVIKNKYDMAIVPGPIVSDIVNNNTFQDIQNLRFMTTMNEQYIFLLSNVNKPIFKIKNLDGGRVGVGKKGGLWERVWDDLSMRANIKVTKVYGTLSELKNKISRNIGGGESDIDDSLDAIMITDQYPSQILNYLFYHPYNLETMRLISLQDVEYLDFLYQKSPLDLNKLPANFLPQPTFKEEDVNYTKASLFTNVNRLELKNVFYFSDFVTYKFPNFLITNNKLDPKLGYLIMTHIFNNLILLNKSKDNFTFLPIEIEKGSHKFLKDKGYITNISNKNCVFLYGKQKCTPDTLQQNQLDFAPYFNLL